MMVRTPTTAQGAILAARLELAIIERLAGNEQTEALFLAYTRLVDGLAGCLDGAALAVDYDVFLSGEITNARATLEMVKTNTVSDLVTSPVRREHAGARV